MKKDSFNFTIIGSGKIACDFSRLLIKNGFDKHLIVTHRSDQHNRDRKLLKNSEHYEDIFEYSEKSNIEIIELDSLSNTKFIKLLKDRSVNYILSLVNRMIFKKSFLDQFPEVYNIHHGILPFERSGSPPSDKILNNIQTIGVTLHKVDEGIDSGPVLIIKTKEITDKTLTVPELNKIHHQLSMQILEEFLEKVLISSISISLEEQNEDIAVTFPRMYSEINGAIDWNWGIEDIEKFVRAFSKPNPGSFTFYKGKKVIIISSEILNMEDDYHPYYIGKIIGLYKTKYVRIVVKGGVLIIKKIKHNDIEINAAEYFKMGETLYTPVDYLERARRTRVQPKNMDSEF